MAPPNSFPTVPEYLRLDPTTTDLARRIRAMIRDRAWAEVLAFVGDDDHRDTPWQDRPENGFLALHRPQWAPVTVAELEWFDSLRNDPLLGLDVTDDAWDDVVEAWTFERLVICRDRWYVTMPSVLAGHDVDWPAARAENAAPGTHPQLRNGSRASKRTWAHIEDAGGTVHVPDPTVAALDSDARWLYAIAGAAAGPGLAQPQHITHLALLDEEAFAGAWRALVDIGCARRRPTVEQGADVLLTAAQLAALCADVDLPRSGTKATVIARLVDAGHEDRIAKLVFRELPADHVAFGDPRPHAARTASIFGTWTWIFRDLHETAPWDPTGPHRRTVDDLDDAGSELDENEPEPEVVEAPAGTRWSHDTGYRNRRPSVVTVDDLVVVAVEETVRALDAATGTTRWERDLDPWEPHDVFDNNRPSRIVASPAGIVAVSTAAVHVLDPRTGVVTVTAATTGTVTTTPAWDDRSRLYASTTDGIEAFESDGTPLWHFARRRLGRPHVHGGLVTAVRAGEMATVVDADTGELVRRQSLKGTVGGWATFGHGPHLFAMSRTPSGPGYRIAALDTTTGEIVAVSDEPFSPTRPVDPVVTAAVAATDPTTVGTADRWPWIGLVRACVDSATIHSGSVLARWAAFTGAETKVPPGRDVGTYRRLDLAGFAGDAELWVDEISGVVHSVTIDGPAAETPDGPVTVTWTARFGNGAVVHPTARTVWVRDHAALLAIDRATGTVTTVATAPTHDDVDDFDDEHDGTAGAWAWPHDRGSAAVAYDDRIVFATEHGLTVRSRDTGDVDGHATWQALGVLDADADTYGTDVVFAVADGDVVVAGVRPYLPYDDEDRDLVVVAAVDVGTGQARWIRRGMPCARYSTVHAHHDGRSVAWTTVTGTVAVDASDGTDARSRAVPPDAETLAGFDRVHTRSVAGGKLTFAPDPDHIDQLLDQSAPDPGRYQHLQLSWRGAGTEPIPIPVPDPYDPWSVRVHADRNGVVVVADTADTAGTDELDDLDGGDDTVTRVVLHLA